MDTEQQKLIFQKHISALAKSMLMPPHNLQGSRVALPYTMFFGDDISIFETGEEFRESVAQIVPRLRAIGMVDLRATVLECVQDSPTRFHCKAQWDMKLRGKDEWQPTSYSYYYMTNPGEDFVVHMTSFVTHPDPNAIDWSLSQKVFNLKSPVLDLVQSPPPINKAEFCALIEDFVNKASVATPQDTDFSHYSFPISVFHENQHFEIETESDYFTHLSKVNTRLHAIGITGLHRRVQNVEFGKTGSFSAHSIWEYTNSLGQRTQLAEGVFSGHQAGPNFKINLLRVTNFKFNDITYAKMMTSKPQAAPADVVSLTTNGETAKIDFDALELRTGSVYPEPFKKDFEGRSSLRLGAASGLTQFGANLVFLEPGAKSSIRHWNEKQDEFAIIVSGELVLSENGGETQMKVGDCAAFPANVANGHCFVNKSDAPASFLVVGTHTDQETAHYPDDDLKFIHEDGALKWLHKNGEPY